MNLGYKKGIFWIVLSYAIINCARLGGNLILTRLLFPEVFGIMALVQVFIQGVEMISDAGFGLSIVHHKEGENTSFVETTWTVSVIRGFILWLLTFLIALPVSWFYEIPELKYLIPAIGVTLLFSSLNSPMIWLYQRGLNVKSLSIFELITTLVSIGILLIVVFIYPTIWSFAIGSVLGSLFKAVFSYYYTGTTLPKFRLDRAHVSDLFHFGKWITVSSILGFIVGNVDRLFLGKVITLEELGVYSIAYTLSNLIPSVMNLFSAKILFPAYSIFFRDNEVDLKNKVSKLRYEFIAILFIPILVFIFFGNYIVNFLYDARYHQAGWILQILSFGALANLMTQTLNSLLLAAGNSFNVMILMIVETIITIVCMALGFYLGGFLGVVLGISLKYYFIYPVSVWLTYRYVGWDWKIDTLYIGLVVMTVLSLRYWGFL